MRDFCIGQFVGNLKKNMQAFCFKVSYIKVNTPASF